jgi:hypothetical protein
MRPDPHTEAAISGDPPQPTRETDLLRAGESLARIARDLGDHAHRCALQDLVDYLTGHLGAPGTAWPVRLPVDDQESKA